VRAEVVEGVVVVNGIRRQHAESFRHVVDAEGGQEALLPIERPVDIDDREVLPRVSLFVPDDHVVQNFRIFVILGMSRLDLHSIFRAFPGDAVFVLVFEEIPPAWLVREHALIALIPLAGVGFDSGRARHGLAANPECHRQP
jgi:hypothetical protein